jgi:diguanylate cyclase (GGDEF)-like protein/PAS domain S-box-containing protein
MQSSTQAHSIKRTLITGFALVLVLLAIMLFVGLSSMADIRAQLNRIVESLNVKTTLVTAMRNAARERTISMYRMITLSDPFARDDEYLRFNHFAAEFANARITLLNMALDEREKEILATQASLTAETVQLQNDVVDLAARELLAEANELLYAKTIPAQDRVFEQLTRLQDYQTQATLQADRDARMQYERAFAIMLVFGGIALLTGVGIATIVIRHTTQNEARLFREKERAQVTLYSIGDGVVTTDARGNIESLNVTAEHLTGWKVSHARGKLLPDILHLVDEAGKSVRIDPVATALAERRVVNSIGQLVLERDDGQKFAVEYTAAPIRDVDGSVLGAVVVIRNITELHEMARQMAYQATHDSLTGLINRHEFETRLSLALESARTENVQHVLLYMDLDQFKVVNDTCGHVAGDELLKQVTERLHLKTRKSDTLARLGGDEFGLLLANCTLDSAMRLAEALRETITDFRFAWEGKYFDISTSIGVVAIKGDSGTLTDVLSAADSACYVAKDLGRNRVHLYQADDFALAKRQGEMRWLPRIRHALEEDRFCLFHQRIVSLDGAQSEHHEILLRMYDDDNRLIPPGAFIPAAERYNLMPAVDRWVIKNAFRFLSERRYNLQDNDEVWTINLSGQTICDDDLLPFITDELARAGIRPQLVCFEITETTAVSNLSRASHLIRELKDKGCRFALDDFGAGLSSFGYLKSLPVDYLKIDGGFVKDMTQDPMDAAMVESINQIGHLLGLRTIAEFVENDATLEKLRALRVDYAQGYGVHRPEPLDAWDHLAPRRKLEIASA